ncbi:MAG TPA: acetate--CoA ligase family protein [Stellaceae bacterium]|nr:acetate--CoA ligase family protein [Stellaceae bacterium]
MSGAAAERGRAPLEAMLRAQSIAVIGASAKAESFGHNVVTHLTGTGYRGRIYPINPRYGEIAGLRCYAALGDVPETVDCAVLAVADERLEAALEAAAAAGARSAVIFGSAVEAEQPGRPPLTHRLAAIARAAGMAMCGSNCMGFLNFIDNIMVGGWPYKFPPPRGRIGFITHSGSSYSGFALNQRQLGMSYMISSGQELVTSAADYLDFLVAQAETRVVGCILETIRAPERFLAALASADRRGIPVVVLKLGRSEHGKALARAHSGALAGADAAYRAVFERYNVVPVRSLDELADTLELLSCGRAPTTDAIGLASDSGGERTMIADLAAEIGVDFAAVTPVTEKRLAAALDPGLAPINPVDIWGTGHDHERIAEECLTALADDPGIGQVVFASNMPSGRALLHTWGRVTERVHAKTAKPVMVMGNLASALDRAEAARLRGLSIPVLMGTQPGLAAIAGSIAWHRARRERRMPKIEAPPGAAVARWRKRLAEAGAAGLDTAASLELAAAFGVPVAAGRVVAGESDAVAAAASLGCPVVLKTLAAGIDHKFDQGGVALGLASPEAVAAAYRDMAARLGPRALVQAQAPAGTELLLGMTRDPQFGPLVTVALGGIFVEILKDAVTFLPPVDEAMALRYLRRLKGFALLDGARNRPRADLGALARAVARFSSLAEALGGWLREMDVNPVIAGPEGVVAVDALAVPLAEGSGGGLASPHTIPAENVAAASRKGATR